MSSALLSSEAFLAIVRDTPLVSIDLVIEDQAGRLLFGLRRNSPARNDWFVPGGRIRKDESLDQAFLRLCNEEIGLTALSRQEAEFLGVYEHFYTENALDEPGFGTHYVVLAYRIKIDRASLELQDAQHEDYRWLTVQEAAIDPGVHAYSRAYLDKLPATLETLKKTQAPVFDAIRAELIGARPVADERFGTTTIDSGTGNAWGRWLSLTTLVVLLLALFIGGTHPAAGTLFIPPWDKAAHASMYFALYLLVRESFKGPSWLLAVLVILIGAADEFHQLSLPTRHAGWDDFAADGFGVLLGLVFRRTLIVKG